jgi:hypothetical protein
VLGAIGGPTAWAGLAGRDALAKHISGNSDAMAGIERHQKKDLNAILAGGEITAGAALSATGAGAAIGAPLIGAGVQQGIKTANMANGGYMPDYSSVMGNGGMVNGGSHQSGHDLAIVDKNTGGDTGIRVEGGEMVFSKERTNALRNAYNQKDYNAVMQIVREQMHNGVNAHKLDDGTGALNLNSPYDPAYFRSSPLLDMPNIPVNDRYNFTNWGTWGQPNNAVNDFNLTNASLGVLQPNIELAGTPTLGDNYGMTPKNYEMTQRQNPEMQYLQDYNTIGTYAKTNPTTPSGAWCASTDQDSCCTVSAVTVDVSGRSLHMLSAAIMSRRIFSLNCRRVVERPL